MWGYIRFHATPDFSFSESTAYSIIALRSIFVLENRLMKKGEAQAAMANLVEKWASEANEPWPPDSRHYYGFGSFWTWLQNTIMRIRNFAPCPMLATLRRCGLIRSRGRRRAIEYLAPAVRFQNPESHSPPLPAIGWVGSWVAFATHSLKFRSFKPLFR